MIDKEYLEMDLPESCYICLGTPTPLQNNPNDDNMKVRKRHLPDPHKRASFCPLKIIKQETP